LVAQARADPNVAQQAMAAVASKKQQIIQQAQQAITVEKVIQLLRSQKIRPFVLDIETDSTIQPDENAEKQRRTEFITAVGGFIAQVAPVVEKQPAIAELAAEMLKYFAQGFRASRELMQVIDGFAEKLKQSGSQPRPPSPEMIAAQSKQQESQAQLQQTQAETQQQAAEHAASLERARLDIAGKAVDLQRTMAEARQPQNGGG
jgi:hypothetical protein